MNQILPSKKFIKFFGIVIGAGLVIWGGSLLFSRKASYSSKDEASKTASTNDDQPFYEVDTDSDGLKDWEEALWQLDPALRDTDSDGVEDSDEVKTLRAEIKRENNIGEDDISNEGLNQTEIFARQFFSIAALASQQGTLTQESLAQFSAAMDDTIKNTVIDDFFTLADLHLSGISKTDYQKKMVAIFQAAKDKNVNEFTAINNLIKSQDPKNQAEMDKAIKMFQELSSSLKDIDVPYQNSGVHLSLTNDTAKIAVALASIKNLADDPLVGILGVKQYSRYSTDLQKDYKNLSSYFSGSAIMY